MPFHLFDDATGRTALVLVTKFTNLADPFPLSRFIRRKARPSSP